METHELIPHPAFPPLQLRSIVAKMHTVGPWLQMRWRVEGSGRLVLPSFFGRHRRDGLWKTTCFELFAQHQGTSGYSEFNLSPSEAWAAYDFTSVREGRTDRPISHDPVITPRKGRDTLIFDAAMPLADLPSLPFAFGFSCVIEEEGGHMSYWAAKHGADEPDFHDPACFAGRLAAPETP